MNRFEDDSDAANNSLFAGLDLSVRDEFREDRKSKYIKNLEESFSDVNEMSMIE